MTEVKKAAETVNNNDEKVANNNYAKAESAIQQLSIGNERVSKWLASSQQRQQEVKTEESKDNCADNQSNELIADSGRPSSIDTDPNCSSSNCSSGEGTTATTTPATEASPPRRDPATIVRGASPLPGDDNDVLHQFLIPNKLGGAMVGTRGRNINYIRAKSGASVWISRNFIDKRTQVVNVRGPSDCVRSALQVIRKRFPDLDVKAINTAVPLQRNPALQPTMCQLSLPVAALIDVNVCAMCRGTTLFVQQPTHPSFHHLEKMDSSIMKHYADHESVPSLPRPVNPGAVCIAPFGDTWHRAIIADVYPEDDLVLMKYLDWGGYERMPVANLKQIRTEMMHLPFQAIESHLAYVTPLLAGAALDTAGSVDAELDELSRTIHERYLSSGQQVKCQVMYFNSCGQPCVYVYTRPSSAEPWQFLQEQLVQAGLMQWFSMPQVPQAQLPL